MLPDDAAKPAAASIRSPKHQPWHHWRTTLDSKTQSLVPDAVFLLEYAGEPNGRNRRLCFIEADRGTMPLVRSRGTGSCIERKLRLYTQLWKSGQFQKTSVVNRIQVWIVTTGAERVPICSRPFPS